jgi:hypothetical protein
VQDFVTTNHVGNNPVVTSDCLMATQENSKNEITVYPNPVKDILRISDIKGVKAITIIDTSGKVVKTTSATSELNLSNLKTGVYLLNLNMETRDVKSFKIIKQ